MRILFMGTPDIAAECLKALYSAGHDICAVYTRRDKPVGRKQVLTAPPVKEVALEHGTPVFQPRTLRDGSEDANIRALAPELIVVVAYGCILPKSVLELPKYGCINLHVSLLPKYRGSAPVQWSVLNGDAETGVSIMQMDEGLDTGDVLRRAVRPGDGRGCPRAVRGGSGHCCRDPDAAAPGPCKRYAGPDAEQGNGRVPPDRIRRPYPQLGARHEPPAAKRSRWWSAVRSPLRGKPRAPCWQQSPSPWPVLTAASSCCRWCRKAKSPWMAPPLRPVCA
mgnify:CR=1 FL=1